MNAMGYSRVSAMSRLRYALEPSGPTRLELVYEGPERGVRVFLDGAPIHTFANTKDLRRGATIALPEGGQLSLRQKAFGGLDVRRNGIPVPGCDSDVKFVLGTAARWMFWIGGVGLAVDVERLVRFAYGSPTWLFSAVQAFSDVVFLGLAALTRGGARWALGVGTAMMLVSAILSWPLIGSLVVTALDVFLFAFLAQRLAVTSNR
jgi:hypothetical protein